MLKFKEKLMRAVFFTAALASIAAVSLICVFLFAQGLPAIMRIGVLDFLLGTRWAPLHSTNPAYGILPFILGSIYVTGGAIILGVPVGIFTAIFMAKVCPKGVYRFIKPALNLMAGVPSVIYGFFGMVVVVPAIFEAFGKTFDIMSGNTFLAASIILGIMILPTIITIAETNLRAVPPELYEGAVALGASHERAIFKVVLPAARSGVMAAVVLGVGRAIGETMAVNMVAGNQPALRLPWEFLKGIRTLTTNIVIEMGYVEYGSLHNGALIATGVVLFIFILIINTLFSILNKEKKDKNEIIEEEAQEAILESAGE